MSASDGQCTFAVCDPASGHGGRVHRGEALLQQPGGHRQPEGPEEAQSLSFQEGNRDLQLLLFQHHPGRQAKQTGVGGEASKRELVCRPCGGMLKKFLCPPFQRLIVCLEESLYIHNIRDMKVLHTIRETPPNPSGEKMKLRPSEGLLG